MDFNLTVTITLSEQLFGLIESRVPAIERRVNKAVDKEIGKKVREESYATVKVEAVRPPKADAEEAAKAKTKTEAKADVEPQPEAMPEAKPEADAPSAAVRIRLAMHKARQRIEGEDHKENTSSEAYKKYHSQMTSAFKQIASLLGADKPSALPEGKVEAFEAECERIAIGDDGNVSFGKAPL